MARVEFRLLQFIVSHLTGDRVSVMLLHWDGTELRIASFLDHLVVCEPAQRDVVRTSVKVIVARAQRIAREVAKDPRLNHGIQELFPVREGRGAALYWTPVTNVETANVSAHFEQLRATMHLDRARDPHRRRFSSHALENQLKALGGELKAVAPQRIRKLKRRLASTMVPPSEQ